MRGARQRPFDEVAFVHDCRLGGIAGDVGHRGWKVRLECAREPTDHIFVLEDLSQGLEGVLDALVRPFEGVGRQADVLFATVEGQVGVFKPVSQGPSISATNRQGLHA